MKTYPANAGCTRRSFHESTGGFTLLELLLATAIFAIVIVSINVVFFAGLRLQRSVTTSIEDSLPMERALAILRKDLQNACGPGGTLAGHFRSAASGSSADSSTSGRADSLNASQQQSAGAAMPLAGSGIVGGLDFFTTTGVLREHEVGTDIQEVNYQLMEPLESNRALGRDLVRTVTRNLLAYSTPVSEEQRLLPNVEAFEVDFYDGFAWRDTWDTSLTETNLPSAVRVKILPALRPEQKSIRIEPYEMLVLMRSSEPVTGSLGDTNSTAGGEM